MKVVFPLAVGCCVAFWPSRAASQLKPPPQPQPPPVTQPVDSIVELSLEDPIKSQSRSYVDLDKGKTFSYGDSTPEDLDLSRQWLRKSGADLMCESRAPADGFVAYDMALVETDKTLDELGNYFEIAKQLQAAEVKGFNAVDVGLVLPKTYLFRTREGEIGGLEISSIDEKTHGLQMRYKLIHQPIPEQPKHVERRGMGVQMKVVVAQHKERLKTLQEKLGENDPQVIREKRQVAYLEGIDKLTDDLMLKGLDHSLYALKRQRLSIDFNLEMAKDKLSDDSPTVKGLQRSLDRIDDQIKARELELHVATQPSLKPTTLPVIFVQ